MALTIPIESIDLTELRRRAGDRRRSALTRQGFAQSTPPTLPLEPEPSEPTPPEETAFGRRLREIREREEAGRTRRFPEFDPSAVPPISLGQAAGNLLAPVAEAGLSAADKLLGVLQPSVPTRGGSVRSEKSATELLVEPLDVAAEELFTLSKLQKPKGYRQALEDFRDRSPLAQIALGVVFDPAVVLGVLGLTARAARSTIRSTAVTELRRTMPGVSDEIIEAAADDVAGRLKAEVPTDLGTGPFEIPPQGVVRSSDNPGLLIPKPLRPIAGESGDQVSRALEQAEAFRTIDAPGFVGGAIDKVPGISNLQQYVRPANKLPAKIQNAWVASGGERAAFLGDQFPSRSRIFQQIDDQFGRRGVKTGLLARGPSPVEGGRIKDYPKSYLCQWRPVSEVLQRLTIAFWFL